MSDEKAKLFVKQLRDQIVLNTNLMENKASLAVECAWLNMYRATQTLFKCVHANPQWSSYSVDTCCLLLLTNSLSDTLNAHLSILHGFYRGPGVILRSVLENLAVAIVIKTSPRKFSDYTKGILKPNETIKPAKKIFSEIGECYGLLTNYFVHEKFETVARNIKPIGNDVDFSLLPEVSKSDLPIPALLSIAYLSRFAGSLAEFFMARFLSDFYYWRKKSDDQLIEFKQNREDLLVNELILEYQNSVLQKAGFSLNKKRHDSE